jgi:phosphatidylglycerophosphate synthase
VIEPILPRIPRSVAPNTITIVSMLVVVCIGLLGIACRLVGAWEAMWLRILLASLVTVYAILDCLDGQHARRTGQTSKLGEILDHCTDALGIPICTAASLWSLEVDNVRPFG